MKSKSLIPKIPKDPNLGGEYNSATSFLNLLLGDLGDELGLDDDGLVHRQLTLAENLEVAVLSHVDQRHVVLGGLVLGLLGDE